MSQAVNCDVLPVGTLSVEQAQTAILAAITTLQTPDRVNVQQAAGRVLVQTLTAPHDVPPYCNASMDGYAVLSRTLQAGDNQLQVVGTSFAGHPYTGELQAGQCVRIMTGAMLPTAADAVLMQENVQREADHIHFNTPVKAGTHVRYPGDDLVQGSAVLQAGRLLNAADVGLIASLGIAEVPVYRRPRVAFCSTGDELQHIGQPLHSGQIYDSNRYTLRAMLEQLGMDIIDMGVVRDDPQAVEQAFRQAMQCADLLITSGGVSVGEADYVTDTLKKLGEVNFWKMAMKPGKPLAFGQLEGCYFFGLPGNPVSVMATFLLFVRPALLKLSGAEAAPLPTLRARCATPLKKAVGRKDFQRAIYRQTDQGIEVSTTGLQESHVLRSMSLANCFVVLPADWGDVAVGTEVELIPFAGLL